MEAQSTPVQTVPGRRRRGAMALLLSMPLLLLVLLMAPGGTGAVTPIGVFCDEEYRIRYDHGYISHRFFDISGDINALQPIVADGDFVDHDLADHWGGAPGSTYFTFFNESFTGFRVFDNGYIRLFGGGPTGGSSSMPQNMPDAVEPNAVIAPLWEDFVPSIGGGRVHVDTVAVPSGPEALVVQWTDMHVYPTSGAGGGNASTFQLVLFQNDTIEFNWLSTENHQVTGSGNQVVYGGVSGIESHDPDGPGPLKPIGVSVADMGNQTQWEKVSYRFDRVPEQQPNPLPDGDADGDGVVEDNRYRVQHGKTGQVSAKGVLANDFDDNPCVEKTVIMAAMPIPPGLSCTTSSPPTAGICADGSFEFAPAPCTAPGIQEAHYRIDDGLFTSAGTAKVSLEVLNQPPVAADDPSGTITYEVEEDQTLTVSAGDGVLGNDQDPDGDSLSAMLLDPPDDGSLTLLASGGFTYTPDQDFVGTDTFTYEASDCVDTSAPATVEIVVLPVNDPPSFVDGGDVSADQDSGYRSEPGWATAISPGPADEQGQNVEFITDSVDRPELFRPDWQPKVLPDGQLTFWPAPGAVGTANVIVHARDDGGNALGGQPEGPPVAFQINIEDVNDPPTFRLQNTTLNATEDEGAVAKAAWAYDIDPGATSESAQTVSFQIQYTNGGLFKDGPAIDSSGTLTFTPAKDGNGQSTVTVRAVDDGVGTKPGDDTSDPQTFSIVVAQLNDAPSFKPGPDVEADEDDPLVTEPAWATQIDPGASDEEEQNLSFDVVAKTPELFEVQPSITADGTLSFKPKANLTGTSLITVRLEDDGDTGGGHQHRSAPHTFQIKVRAINDPPTFEPGSGVTVQEDAGPVSLPWASQIRAGPSDESHQEVWFHVTNDAPHHFSGQPNITKDGTLVFTPAPDAFGSAQVTVRAVDSGGTKSGGVDTSPPVSFTLRIDPVEDAPRTSDVQTGAIQRSSHDEPGQIITMAGMDPDGDPITYEIVEGPSKGTLAAAGSGATREYRPEPYFVGTDSFVYRVSDNKSWSPTATVHITVAEKNDPPSFKITQDPVAADEDAGLQTHTKFLTGITPGIGEPDQFVDLNIEADDPTAFAEGPDLVHNGSVATLTFRPAADIHGDFSVTITASDKGGVADADPLIAQKAFLIRVMAQPDAPKAQQLAFTVAEDSVLEERAPTGGFKGTDADGDALEYVIVDAPGHGQITLEGGADFRYVPDPDFHGQDTFTYRAFDGALHSPKATVTVNVTPVNDPPVAKDHQFVVEAQTRNNRLDVLQGSYDVDGEVPWLDPTGFTPPGEGSLTWVGNGSSLRFTPAAGSSGTTQFTYRLTDSEDALSAWQTVNVTVVPQADPVAFVTQREGRHVVFTQAVVDSGPMPDFRWTFSDGTTATGPVAERTFATYGEKPVRLTLVHDDGSEAYGDRTIVLTNAAPVAMDDHFGHLELQGLDHVVLDVLANDQDPGGDELKIVKVDAVEADPGGAAAVKASVVEDGKRIRLQFADKTFVGEVRFNYTIEDRPAGATPLQATASATAPVDPYSKPLLAVEQVEGGLCAGKPAAFLVKPYFHDQAVVRFDWTVTSGTEASGGIDEKTASTKKPLYSPTLARHGEHVLVVAAEWEDGTNHTAAPLQFHVDHCTLPDASFTFKADHLSVEFNDTSTIKSGGITARQWDFAGEATSTAISPVHVFTESGSHVVSLTVTNDEGRTQTVEKVVTVQSTADVAKKAAEKKAEADKKAAEEAEKEKNALPSENRAPKADAGSDVSVGPGHTVSLDGSDSNDLDGDRLTYRWIQMSGPPIDLEGRSNVTATFETTRPEDQDAVWRFRLVVDDGALSASDEVKITVPYAPPPTVDVQREELDITGHRFRVDASGAGADLLEYEWDFGDGSPSVVAKDPEHHFPAEGVYTVTMTARTPDGDEVVRRTMVVSALPPEGLGEDPAPKQGASTAALISGGALGLVLLGAVAVLAVLLLRRRAAGASSPAGTTDGSSAGPGAQGPGRSSRSVRPDAATGSGTAAGSAAGRARPAPGPAQGRPGPGTAGGRPGPGAARSGQGPARTAQGPRP